MLQNVTLQRAKFQSEEAGLVDFTGTEEEISPVSGS